MDIDVEKERVSLGIKQLTKSSIKEDKFVNKTMTCVIEKIEEDKVFVSFEKGLKGFVKKSNLAKVKTEQNTSRFAVGEKLMQKF